MKKDFLFVKIGIVFTSFIITVYGVLVTFSTEIGLCYFDDNMRKCMIKYNQAYGDPLIFGALFLFITSIFTFFISNTIFKRWLIFTSAWVIVTTILVILAPVSAGDPLGIGPDRELVSIWMSSFFVIISVLMFVVMSMRERKDKHAKNNDI